MLLSMKCKIGNYKIALLVLFFSLFSSLGYSQEEQLSTWNFANKIGWRGVELNLGGFVPMKNQGYTTDYFWKIAPTSYQDEIKKDIKQKGDTDPLATSVIAINLKGIFLPFRNSSKRFLRKMEWHTGLTYQHEEASHFTRNENNSYTLYEFVENSVYFTNGLFIESKSFLSRVKLFAGPGLNLALVPDRTVRRYTSIDKNSLVLSSGKYSFQSFLNVGLKVSLGCRFNIQASYILTQNNWFLDRSFETKTYSGFQMGLRYKFNKPEKQDIERGAPFW